MDLEIIAFGIAKDILGGSSLSVQLPEGATVHQIKVYLKERYPQFSELKSFAIAVNESYARDEDPVSAEDEIVIIPPVSGG